MCPPNKGCPLLIGDPLNRGLTVFHVDAKGNPVMASTPLYNISFQQSLHCISITSPKREHFGASLFNLSIVLSHPLGYYFSCRLESMCKCKVKVDSRVDSTFRVRQKQCPFVPD